MAEAFKSAGRAYIAGGKEAGGTLKSLASLPMLKGKVITLTLDQIVTAVFFLGLAMNLLLLKLISPSLILLAVFLVVGLAFGLGLSFLYYKNKRDKTVCNQVVSD
jgi:hypothetical protein